VSATSNVCTHDNGGAGCHLRKKYARQVRAPELRDRRQFRREGDRGGEWRQAFSRQEGGEGDRGGEWRQALSRQEGGEGDRGGEWMQAVSGQEARATAVVGGGRHSARQDGSMGDRDGEWWQAFSRQEGGEGDRGGEWWQATSPAIWRRGHPSGWSGEWMERCRYGGRMPSQRSVAR